MDPAPHVRNLTRDGVTVLKEYLSARQCRRLRERVARRDETLGGRDETRADRVETPDDETRADRLPRADGAGATSASEGERAAASDGDRAGTNDGDRAASDSNRAVDDNNRAASDNDQAVDDDSATDTVASACGVREDPFVRTVLARAAGARVTPQATTLRAGGDERQPLNDTSGGRYAAVTYLTPVTDRADGPVAYVAGTHRQSRFTRAADRLVTRVLTGAASPTVRELCRPFADHAAPVVATGKRGTTVLVDCTGYGWTLPASDERRLLITQYG